MNHFVQYPLAKQLKEKGFDEPCMMVYYGEQKGHADAGQPEDKMYLPAGFGKVQNSHLKNYPKQQIYNEGQVTAPIYQQVIDWFRTKHNLVLSVEIGTQEFTYRIYDLVKDRPKYRRGDYNGEYYEALIKSIEEGLKLIKS